MSTQCLDCGATIQDTTASRTGGRCVPCARRATPDDDPLLSVRAQTYAALNPNPLRVDAETLLLAMFHPGFSSDLTHWETQIQKDGAIRQQIVWNNFDRPDLKKGVEKRSIKVSSKSLKSVVDAMEGVDIASARRLSKEATIDDAAMISINVPKWDFFLCLPIFAFESYFRRGLLPADSIAGYKCFRDLWNAIDRVSPYSLREHWK